MSGPPSDRRQPVDPRDEVLAYLQAHPDAADSIDGIIDWWLPIQRFETARSAIEVALKQLVSQGLIDEIQCGAGKVLYRLAASGRHE